MGVIHVHLRSALAAVFDTMPFAVDERIDIGIWGGQSGPERQGPL